MTNALANRPAYIEQDTTLNSALGGGLVGSQPPRISSDGDKFTLLDETGEQVLAPTLSIDVVIVGSNEHVSRIFYEPKPPGVPETFDKPPLCFSDNNIGPSQRSPQPQNLTCSGCPQAAWTKTNAKGNLVPWCQSRKNVAVLVAGAGETVYLLSVPPASLTKTWQPYIKYLNDNNAPAQCVITRIHIEKKIWQFKEMGWVPESFMAVVRETIAGDMPANVVNAFDRPISVLPAPAAGLKAVAAAVDYPPNQFAPATIPAGLKAVAAAVDYPPNQFAPATIPAQQFSPESSGPAKISFSMSSTPAPEGVKRGPGRPRAQQPMGGFETAVQPEAEQQQGPSFGMVSDAPPPPAEIQAKLDNVFARFGPK